jgi:excisionase family DNA binding protein
MKNFIEPTFTPSRILTVPQAAEQLQVSERTVYEWLREGKLPGRKIGKVWRLSAEAINDFLRGDVALNGAREPSLHS